MVLKKSIVVFFTVFSTVYLSCVDLTRELTNWTKQNDFEHIKSKRHYLDDDGISVYLPTSFTRYSSIEYLKLLDSLIVNKVALKLEKQRLRSLRNLEGNHYLFYDETIGASYSINTLPHTPISRQDAKYLLGIMRQSQNSMTFNTNVTSTKVTAKYNDNGKIQLFKAIFKLTSEDWFNDVYQYCYFITSKDKTAMIHLNTPFEVEFDPFLAKMIL